jgi:hypothetical protein
MRNYKRQNVICKECKTQYQKRVDTLKNWCGMCKDCTHKVITNKGKFRSLNKRKCIDCGIVNKTFNKTLRCFSCFKIFNIGENHFNFVKDREALVKNEKKHLDGRYRQWMLAVKKRDKWKCKIINSDCKGRLESHHILNWKNYPKLRYDINNGITLCHFHHPRKRQDEINLSPYFKELVGNVK